MMNKENEVQAKEIFPSPGYFKSWYFITTVATLIKTKHSQVLGCPLYFGEANTDDWSIFYLDFFPHQINL